MHVQVQNCITCARLQNYKGKNDGYPYLKVTNLSVRRSLLLLAHCLVVPERSPCPWLTLDRLGSRRAMQGEADADNAWTKRSQALLQHSNGVCRPDRTCGELPFERIQLDHPARTHT